MNDTRYSFVWQKREKQAVQGELPSHYTGAFTAGLSSVAYVGFPLLRTNIPLSRIGRGNPHRGFEKELSIGVRQNLIKRGKKSCSSKHFGEAYWTIKGRGMSIWCELKRGGREGGQTMGKFSNS